MDIVGFDLDGVVTNGHLPVGNDVIITGRSFEESAETYVQLQNMGVYCAVYFNPVRFYDKTITNSGLWKARMIQALGLCLFYEDDVRQVRIIEERLEAVGQEETCNVIKVG